MLQTGSKPTWVWCPAFRQINYIDCWLLVCLRGHLSLVGSHLLSPAITALGLPWNTQAPIPHTGLMGDCKPVCFHEELPGSRLVGPHCNSKSLCFWWVLGVSWGPGALMCPQNVQMSQLTGQEGHMVRWICTPPCRIRLRQPALWLCFGGVLCFLQCSHLQNDNNNNRG